MQSSSAAPVTYAHTRLVFVAPTGQAVLEAVTHNAIANLKQGTPGSMSLPTLRDRARLVVNQAHFLTMVERY